jgi:hypothetical protein
VLRPGRRESHLYACEKQAMALNAAMSQEGPQIMPPSVNPVRMALGRFLTFKYQLLPLWVWKDFPHDRG